MSRGAGDPSLRRMLDGSMWLAGTVDDEPFSAHIVASARAVKGVYWGPGRELAAANFPDLLGAADDPDGFTPSHQVIAAQWRTYSEVLRTPRSLLTWQTALAAILEQRVTGVEARGAWRALVTEHGTQTPGPAPEGMRVPPTAAAVLLTRTGVWSVRLGSALIFSMSNSVVIILLSEATATVLRSSFCQRMR